MKKIFVLFLLAYLSNFAKAQTAHNDSLRFNNEFYSSYTALAGRQLKASATLQFTSIGLEVGSGILAIVAANMKTTRFDKTRAEWVDDNEKIAFRTFTYCMSGALFISGAICELMSIQRKLDAGRSLQMAGSAGGISIRYNY